MSTVAIPLLTVENYKILPETGPRYQLIEGDLYMAPAPNRYHQDISRNLEYILLEYLEKHPIGKLYDAPFDVYLDQYNVFQPDILVVLNDRLAILTEAGAEGAPDFVVEVLSPKTARSTATTSVASIPRAECVSFGSSRRRRGRSKSIYSRRMPPIQLRRMERATLLSPRCFQG